MLTNPHAHFSGLDFHKVMDFKKIDPEIYSFLGIKMEPRIVKCIGQCGVGFRERKSRGGRKVNYVSITIPSIKRRKKIIAYIFLTNSSVLNRKSKKIDSYRNKLAYIQDVSKLNIYFDISILTYVLSVIDAWMILFLFNSCLT